VYINEKDIEFDLRHLGDLDAVDDVLRRLHSDKQNSWEQIHSDLNETFRDGNQWDEYLEPIFKEYYDKNEYDVHYELGTPNYETFYSTYFQMFIEEGVIQDEFIESATRKSYEGYEDTIQKEIDDIEKYMTIDNNEVRVNSVQFINFLLKNNISKIQDNLVTILNEYTEQSNINTSDFDHDYNYETQYPTYKDLDTKIETYFNDLIRDMENTTQCLEDRKAFKDIYSKFFKNNPVYENDYVYIEIHDLRVNCEDGTVMITYKNKKKKKEYTGKVKVKNLPVYVTNYELFENYVRFRENTKGGI
jgi:hypothetical protein